MIACVRRRCVDVAGGGIKKIGKKPQKKKKKKFL